jgi:predicted MPP superfamily phosphohydrolase
MGWSQFEKTILDGVCIASGIGIWPRFIEPRWIEHRHLTLPLAGWMGQPIQVLHLSDLHWGPHAPERALFKALEQAAGLEPDLVLWTGDFLVDADTHDWNKLRQLLRIAQGRFGTYTCLGNHDYQEYVTRDGGTAQAGKNSSRFARIWQRLTSSEDSSDPATRVPVSAPLNQLLGEEQITLLHNESRVIQIHGLPLEIGGVGDPWAGQEEPIYPQSKAPRVLLAHNPDSVCSNLQRWTVALSGHTHGRQINLPWLGQRFCRAQGPYTRGLYPEGTGSWVHVSRGLGCSLPFRVRSRPEITWMTWLPCATPSEEIK